MSNQPGDPDITVEQVTFRHRFTLPGLDVLHDPGTFDVQVRRERLDVSWPAYLLTRTIMLPNHTGVEALDVRAEDLAEALRLDRER